MPGKGPCLFLCEAIPSSLADPMPEPSMHPDLRTMFLYTLVHSRGHLVVLCHIPDMRHLGSCLMQACDSRPSPLPDKAENLLAQGERAARMWYR